MSIIECKAVKELDGNVDHLYVIKALRGSQRPTGIMVSGDVLHVVRKAMAQESWWEGLFREGRTAYRDTLIKAVQKALAKDEGPLKKRRRKQLIRLAHMLRTGLGSRGVTGYLTVTQFHLPADAELGDDMRWVTLLPIEGPQRNIQVHAVPYEVYAEELYRYRLSYNLTADCGMHVSPEKPMAIRSLYEGEVTKYLRRINRHAERCGTLKVLVSEVG